MQSVAPVDNLSDEPLYYDARLVELRRDALRSARSLRPGPERNQHRQIGRSLRSLLRNARWTVKDRV